MYLIYIVQYGCGYGDNTKIPGLFKNLSNLEEMITKYSDRWKEVQRFNEKYDSFTIRDNSNKYIKDCIVKACCIRKNYKRRHEFYNTEIICFDVVIRKISDENIF